MTGPLYYPVQVADLQIMQGARYRLLVGVTCDWEPDISSWVAHMEVRGSRAANAALLQDLSTYCATSPSPSNQQVVIDIDADASTLWTWTAGVYDLELHEPGGDATRTLRVIQGTITLDTEVTR